MNTLKNIFHLLTITILLTACEGIEYDLEKLVKDKNNPIQYVIEGQISNVVKKQHVFISKPGLINGSTGYESVKNATVQVSDGTNTWVFKELSEEHPKYNDLFVPNSPQLLKGGVYESEKYFAGKPNKTYTLKVTINGETFTAQETMPQADAINSQEFEILKNTGKRTSYVFDMSRSAIFTTSNSLLFNSFATKENLKIVTTGRINFFERNYINDTQNNSEDNNIVSTETSTLRKYTATTNYNNYIWAYVFGQGSSVLAIEQNPHPSNFNNAKIAGFFSVINCSQYQVNTNGYNPYLINYFDNSKTYTANYTSKGLFKLELNEHGGCKLIGMGKELTGAYDIINDNQLRIYFTNKYSEAPKELYHFYEEVLKEAFVITPLPNPAYRSDENAIFKIQTDGNIKAQDNTIWNLQ